MNKQDQFTLYVYEGDYGLPSMDVECIQTILYTTVAQVPVEIKYLNNYKNCTFYSAPTFVHKNLTFKGFGDILLYLRTLNFSLDVSLTPKQKSECLALTTLVQTRLKAVLDYVCWIDNRNCEELCKLWFMKALPIPFNYGYTQKMKENALNLMESLYPPDYTRELIKDHLNSIATECFSSLSVRLGMSNYFYGNTPTTLDVITYSYLGPLVKLPWPNNDVSNLISLWPNLGTFIKRMDAKFLPNVPRETKYLKNVDNNKNSDDEVSYVAVSILTISAMSLVFGFAVSRGLLSGKFLRS